MRLAFPDPLVTQPHISHLHVKFTKQHTGQNFDIYRPARTISDSIILFGTKPWLKKTEPQLTANERLG